MGNKMNAKPKKRPRNVYAYDDQWERIDTAQRDQGYSTLSEYMVNRAMSEHGWILGEVAFHLGQLATICNEVLTSVEHDVPTQADREAVVKAVEKVIGACDKVLDILRKG
ncbi:hypothetical protein [Marivita sp. GX14005]|uniref:hypothetical protein n=1 Tax=Marivita sp. GX14005 TaxID=2942276 RepID=UPI002018520F|nr:hypothetical protein [Marivita sp. GX14005]MCL3881906.1 hypothetical protein [Marivita sp. GX14005]